MRIQFTIRSDAAAPIRTKRLEEPQVAHAPAMVIVAGIPAHSDDIRSAIPTYPVAGSRRR